MPEVPLPTQNQLYALYIKACCSLGIRKPNKHIVDLLAEDSYSRRTRLEREAKLRQVQQDDLDAIDGNNDIRIRPLSSLEELPDLHLCGHLGPKGLIAVLTALVKECPYIEQFDISQLPNLFHADPYKQAPSGNEVIRTLCDVATFHPSLNTILCGPNRLGTVAGQMLLDAVLANPNLKSIVYSGDNMHPSVHKQLQAALERNRSGANPSSVPPMPTQLSAAVQGVSIVDRKTSDQRQLLSNLISDLLTTFPSAAASACVTSDLPIAMQRSSDLPPTIPRSSIEAIIEGSAPITLHEVLPQVNSLRGDNAHLYLVARGELLVSFGGPNIPLRLRKGDFFGEPLNCPLYAAGSMEVTERGLAFQIPLDLITPLTTHWAQRADEYMPTLRQVPLLQPLTSWTMVRMCMCSITHRSVVEPTVVPLFATQDEFAGVYVVLSGSVRLSIPEDRPATPTGGDDKPHEGVFVAIGGWTVTPLDMFGFESYFSPHKLSPVSAVPQGASVCLQVGPLTSVNHILSSLKESLLVESRSRIKEAKSVVSI